MPGEVHKGDIGTVFEVTVLDQDSAVVDVSSDPSPEIKFQTSGKVLTKVATFKTDGIDGVIQYKSLSGDLSLAGDWFLQAHVILTSGEWHTTKVPFTVLDTIS